MTRAWPILPLAGVLSACTLGPHAPDAHIVLPPPRAAETVAPVSGPAQTIAPMTVGDWWTSFASPKLDALVEQARRANNDLQTAEATLRQAREQARATAGAQGPQVDASYQGQRARISGDLSSPLADPNAYLYSLQTAQLTVSYPLDLFGGGRSRVRSARAQAEVAAARLAAARTTVTANLVLAVIQHASLEAQIAAARSAIASNRELVDLLLRRRALGDIAESDVTAQQASLANAQAVLPPLERQSRHQAELINALIGRPAGAPLPDLPAFEELALPPALPLALPAEIVANRPDVRAAEAQVRGAAADLGTAIAARLPAITLTGNAGGVATRFEDLLVPGNLFYTFLGGVTQPIFHSGALLHQQRAARAALDASESQYRAAALQAFLDVDDALAGLRTDGAALDAAVAADTAAQRTLLLTRRQVQLGAVGTLPLLNASVISAQSSAQVIQTRAARLADSVALYQASGVATR